MEFCGTVGSRLKQIRKDLQNPKKAKGNRTIIIIDGTNR